MRHPGTLQPSSAVEKKDILPFVTTWMDLKDIMQSEISQIKTKSRRFHLHVESKEYANNKKSPEMNS